MELIVSVSGLRGIVGQTLTAKVAERFAACYAAALAGRAVGLSRDGRPSGLELQGAVTRGLQSVHGQVWDLGIQPTPTVGVAVRKLNLAGAVQITASHNPAEWNGLKLFGADGAVLAPEAGREVAERFRGAAGERGWVSAPIEQASTRELIPSIHSQPRLAEQAEQFHLQAILSALGQPARTPSPGFKVWVDANHGAGGRLSRLLLETLGHEVIIIGEEPTGLFAHAPEPTAANLAALAPSVKAEGCAVGFALDPDADRLALIDENGQYLGEECTLALATRCRLLEAQGPVVINLSTSRMSEEIAAAAGCPCYRAPVGEANVVALMRQVGAIVGGEGNGGVIDPRVGWVRDPFIGMAHILRLMRETGKPLSRLAAELPGYAIVKDKLALDRGRLPDFYRLLEAQWAGATVDRRDGLWLARDEGWLHARPSNTEPIVRLIAEARTPEAARALIAAARSLV
jgi:phosphomannomutase